MKKTLSMFLALTLILGVMVTPANAVWTTSPVYNPDGELIGYVGEDKDIVNHVLSPNYGQTEPTEAEPVETDPATDATANQTLSGVTTDDKVEPVETEPVETEPVETPKPTHTPTPTPTPEPVETDPATAAEATFPDVAPNAWYAEAVNAMATNGVIKGGTDGLFRPDAPITYGELVTILSRVMGAYQVRTSNEYGHWDDDKWYGTSTSYGSHGCNVSNGQSYHWAALDLVYVSQMTHDGTIIAPEDLDCNVTRASALDVVYGVMNFMATKGRNPTYKQSVEPIYSYTEADIPDWKDVMGEAYGKGPGDKYWFDTTCGVQFIGDKLNFWPDEYVKQHEVKRETDGTYTIVNRWALSGYPMYQIQEDNPLMKPYVCIDTRNVLAAYNIGLTNGVDANHTCNAKATITRAELAVMLYRAGLDREYPLTVAGEYVK